MGSDHKHLFLYCNSRWLSKRNVLKRLFELKDEVLIFLNGHPPSKKDAIFPFKDRFHDFKWLIIVANFCDIFATFNELIINLQGFGLNIFKVSEKVTAIIKKMILWEQRLSKGNFKYFETYKFIENHLNCDEEVLPLETLSVSIQEHFSMLINSFNDYFPDITSNNMWIKDPFSVKIEKEEMLNLSEQEVDNLIEISCDNNLKKVFETTPLINFWLRCQKGSQFLMPFLSTYTCEAAFSTLVYLKNKYRNRLDVEPNLRINLTSFYPNLKLLCDDKQHHHSH
ncbi:zinc finger BED domain-containing protein 5-like [Daktulosphaira vitifoliae]|uniref:zinc finger BED domain-containing protein 5-like n=1 Tax=Daktulosphaira vitifoliae TaxID=58002 RepID=UPI0021AA46C0|nr:zinc finger BED domain-containing protein 5-like [Daktulosphaira vitifoliae]